MQINVSMEEAKVLREVLDHYASDLRMQISKTEQFELREKLKETEGILQGLMAQLEQGQGTSLRP
jgi:hypothetical protein